MKYQLSKNAVLAEAEGKWMGLGKKIETGGEESKTVSVRFFSILYIYPLIFTLCSLSGFRRFYFLYVC